MKFGKYDSAILGAVLGAVVAFPSVGTTIKDLFHSIIPASWTFFGSQTEAILIIALFALLGLIFDRTGK